MKKSDIINIILSFIFILWCIISGIFINPTCFALVIVPIFSILFIFYRNKNNNDGKT